MRIGFIGAGKVATAFGRYLHGKGLNISGYFDRHPKKMAHAGLKTQSRPFKNITQVATGSDIILITTRDDQIAGVCRRLCEKKCITPQHLVGHMSGAHASCILAEAENMGAFTFSLHPLQAFADEEKALAELPDTYFSLEGKQNGMNPILHLLSQTGNPYFNLSPEHKSLYHLSACVFSNYLVTLMNLGMSALEKAGIDPQKGFTAMLPLIQSTLANIAELGPPRALTGPIARGDTGTIKQHLAALQAPELENLNSFYTFMGTKTLELAADKTLKDSDKATTMKKLFEKN